MNGFTGAAVPMSVDVAIEENCLTRNAWICPDYVTTRSGELAQALGEHIQITVIAVLLGAVLALPLALLARRSRWLNGLILSGSTAIYTIPSLAMFSLLLGVTGLSITTVITGLVLYSLTILVRNTVAGLAAVPEDALDAARGMGLGAARRFWTVQLPLAIPAVFAGLRIATVSTVAMTTIGTIVGFGGLGDLINAGLRANFRSEVLTAAVLCVLLALALDLLLVLAQKALTPWTWKRRARPPARAAAEPAEPQTVAA